MKNWKALVGGVVLVLAVAGCGDDEPSTSSSGDAGFEAPDIPMAQELGDTEGKISILAWPGYAEDGTFADGIDWVTPFEKATGCNATVKYYGTSDEAFNLMKSGGYDVVAASGDASLRMIASGDVAPVNTDLLKNYADIRPWLKDRQWNSVDGQMYGMPQGWGANLLMWRKDVVKPAPKSWGVVFEEDSPYAGKITAYDSPIYIADAALYLMKTQPDLGIENPYALDEDQLAAAVDLLKVQRPQVSEYWKDYVKTQQSFETGDTVIGTTWQFIKNLITKEPVDAVIPEEGSTGWSDTWMISSKTKVPNCAYAWLDYIGSPEANAASASYFGEAPANAKSCDLMATGKTPKELNYAYDKTHCDTYHAADEAFSDTIWWWTTPISDCLDGRTDVKCTDYGDWTTAWTEIKG